MHHLKMLLPAGIFLLVAWVMLMIPTLFFFVLMALLVITIVTAIIKNTPESQHYHTLKKSLPTSKISSLKTGLVKVKGRFYSDDLITSHIKNRPTVYSDYISYPITPLEASNHLKNRAVRQAELASERRAKTLYIEDISGRIAVDINLLKFDTPHQDLSENCDESHWENNDSATYYQEYYWDMDPEVLLIGTMVQNGFEHIITVGDAALPNSNPTFIAKYAKDADLSQARPKTLWLLSLLGFVSIIPLLLTQYSTIFLKGDIFTVKLFDKLPIISTLQDPFYESLILQFNIRYVLKAAEFFHFIPPSIITYAMIYFVFILLVLMPLNILIAKNRFLHFFMRPLILTTFYVLLPSLIIFITARLFNFNFPQLGFAVSITAIICFLIALTLVIFNPKLRQSAASKSKEQASFGLIR